MFWARRTQAFIGNHRLNCGAVWCGVLPDVYVNDSDAAVLELELELEQELVPIGKSY